MLRYLTSQITFDLHGVRSFTIRKELPRTVLHRVDIADRGFSCKSPGALKLHNHVGWIRRGMSFVLFASAGFAYSIGNLFDFDYLPIADDPVAFAVRRIASR